MCPSIALFRTSRYDSEKPSLFRFQTVIRNSWKIGQKYSTVTRSRARERVSEQSEQCRASKWVSGANGRARGPLLTSRFQEVLNQCFVKCMYYSSDWTYIFFLVDLKICDPRSLDNGTFCRSVRQTLISSFSPLIHWAHSEPSNGHMCITLLSSHGVTQTPYALTENARETYFFFIRTRVLKDKLGIFKIWVIWALLFMFLINCVEIEFNY